MSRIERTKIYIRKRARLCCIHYRPSQRPKVGSAKCQETDFFSLHRGRQEPKMNEHSMRAISTNRMPHLKVETIFGMSLDPATQERKASVIIQIISRDLLDGISTPARTSSDRSVSINLANMRCVRVFKCHDMCHTSG